VPQADDVVHDGRVWLGGRLATGVIEASNDPAVLDRGGWWAVVLDFEGGVRLWRFEHVDSAPLPAPCGRWQAPAAEQWTSSMSQSEYLAGVRDIRSRIYAGDVYQVNLCRLVSAPVPDDVDLWALAARLATGNPAPYAGVIDVPRVAGLPATRLVSASPELFLGRDGELVRSAPIKGTARTADGLLPKDEAENVMIVDLVRNDLQHVCRPGTVEVPGLLRVEQHPGLVHLVSTVQGRLADGCGWPELLAATMPPGSVSGAPKSSALRAIDELEPVPRGPYCGGIGWVDADRATACLAVGIRTFWVDGGRVWFGTGAGITWGSDPEAEWEETQLKARRLVGLAGAAQGQP
jgi:para-aminobenzoate synthetase component I